MSADSFDLASLEATDAWLDDVSARTASPGDPLAASLVGWLDQIDAAYQPRPLHVPVVRPRRFGRRSASLAAAGVLVLAGAGTAVAAPSSPVHRALFGSSSRVMTPVPRPDETAELSQAAGLVASAAAVVASGEMHGFLADDARASAAGSMDRAVKVLEPLPGSPVKTSLEGRITMLRLELGQLPNQPRSTTTPPSQPARATESPRPQATPPAGEATSRTEPSDSPVPSGGDGGDSTTRSSSGSDH